MNKFGKISGIISFVFLLAGFILNFFYQEDFFYWKIALLIGVIFVIIFILFSMQEIKTFFKNKNLRYGANAVVLSIVVLSILAVINLFNYQYHFQWDFTKLAKYTLSEQTRKVLGNLKNDIKITCFFQDGSPDKEFLKDLLKDYSSLSKKVKFEFIDPDKNPKVAKGYKITEYGIILFESDGRENRTKGISEQDITNTIIKVTRKSKKVIYFTEDHGEKDINALPTIKDSYSIARDLLVKESYEVKKISLLTIPSVPDNCSALVIGGPKKEFSLKEEESINNYLLKGGKALFLLDPDSSNDLDDFLKKWGIKLQRNSIVDKIQFFGGDNFIPAVNTYGSHEITGNFNYPTLYPLAQSISSGVDKEQKNLTFIPLAMTSANSWGKKNPERLEFNQQEDQRGPLTVACVVTKSVPENKGKNPEIVVFGDSDFVSNAYFNLFGNGDLFLNSVNWLAKEQDLISIRPKPREFSSVNLTRNTGNFIFFVVVILFPCFILIFGGVIWIKRRKL